MSFIIETFRATHNCQCYYLFVAKVTAILTAIKDICYSVMQK